MKTNQFAKNNLIIIELYLRNEKQLYENQARFS